MTAEGDLIGGRYRVARRDRALGGLRRVVAGDTHLDRSVLAWVSDSGGPEEDALLEVARRVGQAPHAAFLRVLDVAADDQGVAVILESPGPSLARSRGPAAIDRRGAEGLLDAIERAGRDDLPLARLAPEDLFALEGDVLADPIALLLPRGRGEAPASVDDLVALLVEHAKDGPSLDRALRGARRTQMTPPGAAGVAVTAPPYIDDEPTVVFTPPAATALAERPAPPSPTVAPAAAVEEAEALAAGVDEAIVDPVAPRRDALPWRVFIPLYGALAIVVVGVLVFALRSPSANTPPTSTASAGSASGPPAVAPATGHVTVGLAATEDSGVRVMVDGIVQFDGTLKTGQRQSWDGKQRIDVWTDKGKTLQLAVNGKDLGPYSPAMGHADWNRIDFSFWPGFGQ